MLKETLFEERQSLAAWVWILLGSTTVLLPLSLTWFLPEGRQILWLPAIIIAIDYLVFGTFGSMHTTVTDQEVLVVFGLFHWIKFRYLFKEISGVEVRTYSPIKEYGGWGIRFGFKGRALNMRGNRGVEITVPLSRGSKVMIGSQKPEKLHTAIQTRLTLAERL